MSGFTCKMERPDNEASEDPFMIKHMHQVTSPQSSSFLSVHTTPYLENASRFPSKTPATSERNAITRSISPCFSTISDTKTFHSAIEIADIYNSEGVSSTVTEIECPTPDSDISMEREWEFTEVSSVNDVADAKPSTTQDMDTSQQYSSEYSRERPSLSRDSSLSKPARRSTSPQSTENRSSSSNHRSSKHRQRRMPKDHNQKSAGSTYRSSYSAMSPQKHHDLLSLHQSSCRLFQTQEPIRSSNEHRELSIKKVDSRRQEIHQHQGDRKSREDSYPAMKPHMRSYSTPAKNFTSSTSANSAAHSSLLNSYGIYLPYRLEPERELEREESNRAGSSYSVNQSQTSDTHEKPSSTHKPHPATVIDWTSPSTRRREYEKIDRSHRGIRGLWRRFAPQVFQLGDQRTPFFEEGKGGNGVYGGSVRRFRMDFSDDCDEEVRPAKIDARPKSAGDGTYKKENDEMAVEVDGARLRDERARQKWKRFKFKR